MVRISAWFGFFMLVAGFARLAPASPKPGFVLHFNFISNIREARELVRIAAEAGAQVVNVVPPAHIWESKPALEMLEAILDEISQRKLSFVFTRIDAAFPPVEGQGERVSYLYGEILTAAGKMPNGRETSEYFLSTVGRKGYAEWMEEETRYYAEHYGRLPNLLGINLGPFSEPFSAERCGFLEYEKETQRYEITQYTPEARDWFHRWLTRRYDGIHGVNREYTTNFSTLDQVPLPLNERDSRFGRPDLAYFDFVQSLNDWLVECYERCRRIWHRASGRDDAPFILQLNALFTEKLAKGRPSFAAFDVPRWIAMADAVGLSLYTNSGYPDFGHAGIRSAVNLLALARDLNKDVFVLEGGTEAPNVILDPKELSFYGGVARNLKPLTYIYEFLKDKFDEPYPSNPGKLVTAEGKIRQPAFKALRSLFREIQSDATEAAPPGIYFVSDAAAVRKDLRLGLLNAALYDMASDVKIRWIPAGAESIMRAGVPILMQNGIAFPADAALTRLFRDIPPVDALERERWRKAAVKALQAASAKRLSKQTSK